MSLEKADTYYPVYVAGKVGMLFTGVDFHLKVLVKLNKLARNIACDCILEVGVCNCTKMDLFDYTSQYIHNKVRRFGPFSVHDQVMRLLTDRNS